jgi:hypothetical protein
MKKGEKMSFEMRKKLSNLKKGIPSPRKGVKLTLETRKKLSLIASKKIGNKNNNWKGDKVGPVGIHHWLSGNFVKLKKCQFCKKIPKKRKNGSAGIEWALIKGKTYERKRENFLCLCRRCHAFYDGIIDNIINYNKKKYEHKDSNTKS